MFSSYDIVCKSQGFYFKFSLSTNGQVLTSGSLDWTVQVSDVASSDLKFTSYVQENCMGIPMLIDVEKKREGLDDLLNLTDYVVCSAKFPQVDLDEDNELDGDDDSIFLACNGL
ncbi:hypothetical protein POM88_036023 [Heracleum sosnowskyi]|uniref:Uncharacterized protein n=1 Tax=Heracleum sosnowskyi TaxID=360622 RepID=A0AAD8MDU3_9APIA|nr:hypothetical protein POM88_036023 [Heracleum sosnowskyi]